MPTVTLTFDNGPCVDTTPTVLDELVRRGLRAWFCIVGDRLREPGAPTVVERVAADGHRLVNHSLTHATPLGDDPSHGHARREIVEMDRLLTESLPAWGDDRWFRPFGRGGRLGPHVFSTAALDELDRLEYSVLLWNCVPRDWIDHDGWVDTALAEIEQLDHAVVVLHDIAAPAMRHLPRFLDELERRDVAITADVPDECVPIRGGEPQRDLAALTTVSPSPSS